MNVPAALWMRRRVKIRAAVIAVAFGTSLLLIYRAGGPLLLQRLLSARAAHGNQRSTPNELSGVTTKRPGSFYDKSRLVPRAKPIELRFSTKKKMFTPWSFSLTCDKYKTRLAQFGSLPRMALSSFPGSGNTWVRYLIEGATGVFTGSIYFDPGLVSKGFYGELVKESCGCTLVQKTHGYTVNGRRSAAAPAWSSRQRMVDRLGGRAVLLIRNPYEALLAFRNFAAGHIGHIADNRFTGKAWEEWVTKNVNLWRDFNIDWLNMTSSVHVIHYEHLKRDPILELRNFLRFIGLPEDEARLTCIEKYPDGQLKRKSSWRQIFNHRDVFSPWHHALLNSAIDSVQRQLVAHGHPPLPLARYKYYATSVASADVSRRQASADGSTLHAQP